MGRGDSTSSSSRTKRSPEPTAAERALFERAMADVRPIGGAARVPPLQPSPASQGREPEVTPADSLPRLRGRVGEGARVTRKPHFAITARFTE